MERGSYTLKTSSFTARTEAKIPLSVGDLQIVKERSVRYIMYLKGTLSSIKNLPKQVHKH